MKKALQTVSQFFNDSMVNFYSNCFMQIKKMQGANRIFRRIASASNKEQLQDSLVEIQYALVFAARDFLVKIEPQGKKGPDLEISRDSHQAFVEITRFRKIYPGPSLLDLSDKVLTLPEYGNPQRDIKKALEKISMKFSQVSNKPSIIAIWNDDEDMEAAKVETAVNCLRDDAIHNVRLLPRGLLFVLYGSTWVQVVDKKQLFCFPLHYLPSSTYQVRWQRELDSSNVNELIRRIIYEKRKIGGSSQN